MAENAQRKPTTLADAMKILGGVAGFLWGGGIGSEDPEIGFWIGALLGAAMGAFGGWLASLAVRVTLHVGFLVAALALIGARIYWYVSHAG